MSTTTADHQTDIKTFKSGSYVIDMGNISLDSGIAMEQQLKPYGLIYELTVRNSVPVEWAIDPNKTDIGGADFIAGGTEYGGGSFVISSEYIDQALSTDTIEKFTTERSGFSPTDGTLDTVKDLIEYWETQQNVQLDLIQEEFTAPIFGQITTIPRAVLDFQNGGLAVPYMENAGIDEYYLQSEADTEDPFLATYVFLAPRELNGCHDVYVMPHADPDGWDLEDKVGLFDFITTGGWMWAADHAVSALEYTDIPAGEIYAEDGVTLLRTIEDDYAGRIDPNTGQKYDPSNYDDGRFDFNFLGYDGGIEYFKGSSETLYGEYGGHNSGETYPFSTNPEVTNDPEFQILKSFTEDATRNGSEQIYLPFDPVETAGYPGGNSPGGWRDETTVAIYDAYHSDAYPAGDITNNTAPVEGQEGVYNPVDPDNPTEEELKYSAGVVAYGRAFGVDEYGGIYYTGGHSFAKGDSLEWVSAQRSYLNFLLLSGMDRAPEFPTDLELSPTIAENGTIDLTIELDSKGHSIVSYNWSAVYDEDNATTQANFTNESLEVGADGIITIYGSYTAPTFDVSVTDKTSTIRLVVQDACGRQAIYTHTFDMNNLPPVGNPDSYCVIQDQLLTLSVGNGVLANDYDGDYKAFNQGLIVDIAASENDENSDGVITTANGGTVYMSENGSFTYAPADGFVGEDTFNYVLDDGEGGKDTQTVHFYVSNPDDPNAPAPPVANDDTFTFNFGDPYTINEGPLNNASNSILGNDSAADDTVSGINRIDVITAKGGTITDNGDGTYSYTPPSDVELTEVSPGVFKYLDSFTYTIYDGHNGGETATVTIELLPPDPVANDDNLNAAKCTTTVFNASEILANDLGDGLTITSVQSLTEQGAKVILDKTNQTISYVAPAGIGGADSFTYTVVDEYGQTRTATVNLDLIGFNNVANADFFATDEIPATSPRVLDVLANDTGDLPFDPDSVTIKTITQDGNIVFDLTDGLTTNDTLPTGVSVNSGNIELTSGYISGTGLGGKNIVINYEVSAGGQPLTADATVYVGQDQRPANVPDSFTIPAYSGKPILLDVTANDYSDLPLVELEIRSDPSLGTATVVGTKILYTPRLAGLNNNDTDTLEYRSSTDPGAGNQVVVTITASQNQPVTNLAENDYTAISNTVFDEDATFTNNIDNDTTPEITFVVLANDDASLSNATIEILGVSSDGSVVNLVDYQDFIRVDGQNIQLTDFDGLKDNKKLTITYQATDPDDGSVHAANMIVTINDVEIATSDDIVYVQLAEGQTSYTAPIHIPILDNDYIVDDGPDDGVDDDTFNTTTLLELHGTSDLGTTKVNTTEGTIDYVNGEIVYTPNDLLLVAGTVDEFTYLPKSTDGTIEQDKNATVTVVVLPYVDPAGGGASDPTPTATADTATTERSTPVTINVLTNDLTTDGKPYNPITPNLFITQIESNGVLEGVLELQSFTTDNGGTVTFADSNGLITTDSIKYSGGLIYTPQPGFSGTDTFSYTVVDDTCEIDTVEVTITVETTNRNPVLDPDTVTVCYKYGQTAPPAGDNVFDHEDLDANGVPDGGYDYDPDGGQLYLVKLEVETTPGSGTFTTLFDQTNGDIPVQGGVHYEDGVYGELHYGEDFREIDGTPRYLGNLDYKADADYLKGLIDDDFADNGTVDTYTIGSPISSRTFRYTAQDSEGSTATSTMTFDIERCNVAPSPQPDEYTINLTITPDTPAIVTNIITGVTGTELTGITYNGQADNDVDPEHDPAALKMNSILNGVQVADTGLTTFYPAVGGTVTIDKDGNMTYDYGNAFEYVGAGETITTSFLYSVIDPNGAIGYSEVIIKVTTENEAPVDITIDKDCILENLSPGAIIGGLETVDPDQNDTHTYSIVNVTDVNGTYTDGAVYNLFTVNDQDELVFTASADYESPDLLTDLTGGKRGYRVLVETTDANGATYQETLEICIEDTDIEPTKLSGFVYNDLNQDGIFDANETGIGGVSLSLDKDGSFFATATTTASGYYEFTYLRNGNYTVTETQPTGYHDGKEFSKDSGNAKTANVIDNSENSDTIGLIPVVLGTPSVNNNFGEYKLGSISGTVFEDLNNDGLIDAGEAGISGVTVELYKDNGTGTFVSEGTFTTSATGEYQFTDLVPGNYEVRQPTQPTDYFDGKDSRDGTVITENSDTIDSLTIAYNSDLINNNFGEYKPGTATLFKNITGIGADNTVDFEFDPSWDTSNFFLDAETTDTDGDGYTDTKVFTLEPGTYSLAEVNLPENWSLQKVGITGNLDSADDGFFPNANFTLDSGENLVLTFNNDYSAIDYGDLPDTFKTTQAVGGPAHTVRRETLFLGALIDGESDGQPTVDATGDDTNYLADEDGVVFGTLSQGEQGTVTVTVKNTTGKTSYLNAWLDWDNSGTFEAGEQIFTNQVVTDGVNNLTIDVPADAVLGNLGSRFRLSTSQDLGSDNSALPTNLSGDTIIGGVNLGSLTDYLFFFGNASEDANWQGATKGFAGDVAVNGITASEGTSGAVPYAGTIYTNDTTAGAWQDIVDQNSTQAFVSIDETALITGLTDDINQAFTQINDLTATLNYESVSATSLNGLNTVNGTADTYVINITSGFSVSSKINITGDTDDVFILRWDLNANSADGYQGQVKFSNGGGIVPLGDLTAGNFIHLAGDLNASGGGSNPAAPYPQGPRYDDGTGDLITNGDDFNGGGFFTGYWLTTGKPDNLADATWDVPYGGSSSLSNGIFVGGWYTINNEFSMTSGTSGVHVSPPSTLPLPDGEVEDYFVTVAGPTGTGVISGYVYQDVSTNAEKSNNGNFDNGDGETGITGVTLELFDSGNNSLGTMVTDGTGYYEFTNLPADTYKVVETQPVTHLDGLDNRGGSFIVAGSKATDEITGIVLATDSSTFSDVNFGELLPNTISGTVWDVDGSPIGIDGVTLTLTGTNDLINETIEIDVVTSGGGNYSFGNLRPGNYTITQTQPSGYEDAATNPVVVGTVNAVSVGTGNDNGTAQDTITNIIIGVDPGSGQSGIDYDFNETTFTPPTGSIAGRVYEDVNNNGLYNSDTDTGIHGLTMTLKNSGGNVITTTTTNGDGSYQFSNLAAGTYTVEESEPVNYIDKAVNVGSIGGSVVGNSQLINGNNDKISNIVLPSAGTATGYNFGEVKVTSVGGRVFEDQDNNGIFDGTETGIANVLITLQDSSGVVLTSSKTDVNGLYSFTNLPSGSYRINQPQEPNGYADGKDSSLVDTNYTIAADLVNETFEFTLNTTDPIRDYSFGETLASSPKLSGTVHLVDTTTTGIDDGDYNPVLAETGIGGVNVILYQLVNNAYQQIDAKTTASDGSYEFTLPVVPDLETYTYKIVEQQPRQYNDGFDGASRGTVGNDVISNITVAPADNGNTISGFDFGELTVASDPTKASISGKMWVESDGSELGVFDGSDSYIVGELVELYSGDFSQYYSTTIDSNGEYLFNDLDPGNYFLVEGWSNFNYSDSTDYLGIGITPGTDDFGFGTPSYLYADPYYFGVGGWSVSLAGNDTGTDFNFTRVDGPFDPGSIA